MMTAAPFWERPLIDTDERTTILQRLQQVDMGLFDRIKGKSERLSRRKFNS